TALMAFQAGYAYPVGKVLTHQYRFEHLPKADGRAQITMDGNQAIAYGLIAAGVRFGAGYPITPWSSVMETLRRELPKYGGIFVQAEDELASVSLAIGMSYSGWLAVTGSAGPGISLKTEAIGWASMAEIPLIICNVQRGGPSTGLPTNVEQSDLHRAMTAKRRNKLRKLAEELQVPEIYGDQEGDTLLVGWGSTYGPIHDAVKRARTEMSEKIGALHLRHIHPLPNGLEKIWPKFKRVVVVEMNDSGVYGYGQLATILRARFCEAKIESVTKTDGLTFRVREILENVFKGRSFARN